MIAVKDRSGWMGCSDCERIVGNIKTETWRKWWMEKLGFRVNNFENKYTRAGTNYEHKILMAVNSHLELDHQTRIEDLRVRANFDGIDFENIHIYECKTFNGDRVFKVSKQYWRQAQMEMWALEQELGIRVDKLTIVAYPMTDAEYGNYWLDIDKSKIEYHEVERDDEFINDTLVPRIKYLSQCLKKGVMPDEWIEISA